MSDKALHMPRAVVERTAARVSVDDHDPDGRPREQLHDSAKRPVVLVGLPGDSRDRSEAAPTDDQDFYKAPTNAPSGDAPPCWRMCVRLGCVAGYLNDLAVMRRSDAHPTANALTQQVGRTSHR